MSELHKPAVGILASGRGTTAERLVLDMVARKVDVEIPVLIYNRPSAEVASKFVHLNRIHKLGIEIVRRSHEDFPWRHGEVHARGQTAWESEEICSVLEAHGVDLVTLMGYDRIVTGDTMQEYGFLPIYRSPYRGRMLNWHPGPLPLTANTQGAEASEITLASGRKTTESTVHLVSPGVDRGPVFARHRVTIMPGDNARTLNGRVQAKEKETLADDVSRFLREQAEFNKRNRRRS